MVRLLARIFLRFDRERVARAAVILLLTCAPFILIGCYSGLAGITVGIFQVADDSSSGNGADIAPRVANLEVAPDGPLGRATNLEEVRVICDVIPGSAPLREVTLEYSLNGQDFRSIQPDLREEDGTRHVLVWNAARDGLSGLNRGVHVRVGAEATTGATDTETGMFDLGNTPPVVTDLAVVGADKGPVNGTIVIRFTLRDASEDPAQIELEVVEDGGDPQEIQPSAVPVGTLNALPTNSLDCIDDPEAGQGEPQCRETTLAWDTVKTLMERNLTNLTLRITPSDLGTNGQGLPRVSTLFDVNNNAPPAARVIEPRTNDDETGAIRIRFVLADEESQLTDAVVQWSTTPGGFPDISHLTNSNIRRAAVEEPAARAGLQIVTPKLRTLFDASAMVPAGQPADVLFLQNLVPPTGLTCARIRGAALDLLAPNGDVEQTRRILRDCDCCEVDPALQRIRLDIPLDPPPRDGQRIRVRESMSRLLFDLPTTPAGREYSVAWDTLQDLGLGCDGQSYLLRVTPFAIDAEGTTVPSTVDKPVQTNHAQFAAVDDLTPARGPSSIVLLDIDQDGNPDLLSADRFAQEVSIFRGLGDGSFSPREALATAGEPVRVVPVFLEGTDPAPDILVAVATEEPTDEEGYVDVFVGSNTGEFAHHQRLVVTGEITDLIATSLLDSSHADIVAVTRREEGELAFFRGRDNGTFEPVFSSMILGANLPANAFAVAGADLDGNGLNDLLVASENAENKDSDEILVYLQTDEKSFVKGESLASGKSPNRLIVAHLNDDAHWDVVSVDTRAGQLSVFYGNGDGTFGDSLPLNTGVSLTAAVAADLNGDARCDLVTLVADRVSFFLHDLDGTFVPGRNTLEVGTLPRALAAGDVNRDGIMDVVAVDGAANSLKVRIFLGQGIFAEEPDSLVETHGEPLSMVAADLDGDLDLDLVVGSRDPSAGKEPSGLISVFLNSGEGMFSETTTSAVEAPVQALVAADFNGDGNLDIASAERSVTAVRSWSIGIFLGDGNGSLARHSEISTDDGLIAVAAGDFDGDGDVDLVSAEVQRLMLIRGNGDGSFEPGDVSAVGAFREQPLEVADLNGDGWLDLMTADRLNQIRMFSGNGAGQFEPTPIGFLRPTFPNALTTGDMNGDGFIEIVSVESTPTNSQVAVFEGVANGIFELQPNIVAAAPSQLSTALVTDLNHDQRQDFVMIGSQELSVFLQTENGVPRAPQSPRPTLGANPPTALIAVDVNGDGDKDLIVAERARLFPGEAQTTNLFSVFLNRFRGVLPQRGRAKLREGLPFRCR